MDYGKECRTGFATVSKNIKKELKKSFGDDLQLHICAVNHFGENYTEDDGTIVLSAKRSDVRSDDFGRFANDDGRILPGLYCVGWARRGPSGTIGTNKPDGFAIVERIVEDIAAGSLGPGSKSGRAGFDRIAAERGLQVVTFRDWKKIEEAEEKAAREGAPREKFVDVEAMIRAKGEA